MALRLTLSILEGQYAVCRLAADEQIPAWATRDGFISITRTEDELSVVCADDGSIPADARCERGWKLMRVAGAQPFELTGVLSSILKPLADSGISIFAVSTFDTDYVMVKREKLEAAAVALRAAGHIVG